MAIAATDLIQYFEDYHCPICRERIVPRGGFTTWFRIKPSSAQVLHNAGSGVKKEYEDRIKKVITEKNLQMIGRAGGPRYPLNRFDPENVYGKGAKDLDVCVGLFFGLSPECTDKDADNMTKLFLDALKGGDGLLTDDKLVTHLEIIKRVLVPDPVSAMANYLVGVRISMVSSSVKRQLPLTLDPSIPII